MEGASAVSARNRERIFERRIIHWCAPTLAGAKPANLFTFVFEDGPACRSCPADGCRELSRRAFAQALKSCRQRLQPAGIGIDALTVRKNGALLFVYRKDLLRKRLQEPLIAAFLMERGYNPFDERGCLWEMARRIRRMDGAAGPDGRALFPHEIGLLLGYPYQDVVAFMDNRCDGVRAGAWMAYGNVEQAQACACRYRRCRYLCEELDRRGVPLEELARMDEASMEAAVCAA
ncbi:MAG: DUF3793 family protein [Eggerthellaceae bacterium]|jgi:hypothetical protein